MFRRRLSICMGLWLLASLPLPADRVLLDGVAVKVNDKTIPVSDVMIRLQPLRRELEGRYVGDDLQAKLQEGYEEQLNALINEKLILDAYEDQEGRLPEWTIDKRIGEMIQEQFQGDREALMTALEADQVSYDDWRENVREQLIASSMRQNRVQRRIMVSANDIYATYQRNIDQYREPPQVRVSMIVLKPSGDEAAATNAVDRAEALRRDLLDGADFGELARTTSQGPRAEAGGQWSWIEVGMLRPELKAVLDKMAPGDISPVIATDDEVYLFRLDARRGGGVQPFEAVRKEIEQTLRREEGKRLYDEWIADLRQDAYIQVVHANPFAK